MFDVADRCMMFGYSLMVIMVVVGLSPTPAGWGFPVKFVICDLALLAAMIGFYWCASSIRKGKC